MSVVLRLATAADVPAAQPAVEDPAERVTAAAEIIRGLHPAAGDGALFWMNLAALFDEAAASITALPPAQRAELPYAQSLAVGLADGYLLSPDLDRP